MGDIIYDLVGRQDFTCVQLVIHIYKKAGLSIPNIKHSKVEECSVAELRPYDMIFFDFTGKNRIDHIGVYISDGRFIHCLDKTGVIISNLTHRYFGNRYMGRLING
jgi:cell wall-associated NlpC family hydrolase